MAELVRLSEATALALHALALTAKADGPLSVPEIAAKLRASEAHVAKVMQRLAQAGLVLSKRGPRGGYALARAPQEIRLLEVYEAMEGKLRLDGCVFSCRVCEGQGCIFGDLLAEVRARVHAELARRTLAHAMSELPA